MMHLLESQKTDKKRRSVSGTISSVILHVLVIFLAVFATARAGTRKPEKARAEKVNFVAMKKDEPPPPKKEEPKPKEPPKPKEQPKPKPPTPKLVVPQLPKEAPLAPPKGFKVLAPPVNVPTKLPSIDLSKALTNENDFSGKGVAGGSSNGVKGGTGKEGDAGKSAGVKAVDDHVYTESQWRSRYRRSAARLPSIRLR